MNADTTTCITCGTPLPGQMLGGKCPACLKKVALAEPTLPGDSVAQSRMTRRHAAWSPPSVEEVAALLPKGFYSVESFIGRGGMGAVYKGTQTVLKRPVAIKIMRQDQALDAEFRLRFLREAQMLARLSHPGIVNVIDCGEAGPDFLFIVMEFVDGANLMDVIRGGGVSEARALTIMKQVCEALQFAHAHGIVHRDIKPSNIILMRDGRIKLADFGLAAQMEPEEGEEGDANQVGGTPAYAAPEQMRADGTVDQRADLYSLGVMIYQMLTGELPRGDWKPPSQAVAIDPAWDKIVSQALQPLPQDRLSAADAMQEMLSRISPLKDEQIRRRRTRPILLVTSLVVLAVVLWILFDGSRRDKNYPTPKTWAEATPELRATAERYHFGQMSERWLQIREDAHFDLADSREFSDVAMRVTYSGWVRLGLRGTMDEYYIGEVRPDGDAIIALGTTNVVEHPDVQPVKFSLGKSYDAAKEHELVFAAQGDTMRLWLDGHEVLSFKDTILARGRLYLRGNVSPNPQLPARILRLEYAALGSAPQPEPPQRSEFKPAPGSIADVLTSPEFKWTAPENLGPGINAEGDDVSPHLSPDSLILNFASKRKNLRRLYECKRESSDAAFGPPQLISSVDGWPYTPWITPDRRTLVYMNPGGPGNMGSSQDLYMRQRRDANAPWGPAVNLDTVNHQGHDQSPCLTSDGLTLYFGSLRGGGYGGHDMWRATRKSVNEPFGGITNLGPTINTYIQERDMHLCSDDRTLLFVRQHNEGTVSTSVLHMAVPDERGGYHVQALDVPFQGMMMDPCLSHDARTLLFAWKGPSGSGALDLWQMRRVPKDQPVTTPQPALATVQTPFANTLGMRFVPVPITGGATDGQRVLFSVWETRVQDYEAFVKATGREWPRAPFEQSATHPAVNVSWEDAQAFCRWLTDHERKAGAISEQEHYRLPLDHEWSCAIGIGGMEKPSDSPSRKNGGLPDVFSWGTVWPPPAGTANFRGEECPPTSDATTNWVIKGYRDPYMHTAPVGSFPPGPSGLHDFSGNVREWIEEWQDSEQRFQRMVRGGDHTLNDAQYAMSAARPGANPKLRDAATGFRVVLGRE
ncbi:MAG: bifunctional serine/threonine-protein kinase/formylglycine-generating enzyme family protein [Verrucomicrobiaceae bacterium]